MTRGDGLGRVRLAAAMLAVVLALGVTALVAHALRSGERARRLEHAQAAERVFASVRALGIEVIEHALPDHVDFRATGTPEFAATMH